MFSGLSAIQTPKSELEEQRALKYYDNNPAEMRQVKKRHERVSSEVSERPSLTPPDTWLLRHRFDFILTELYQRFF